jgi:phospholipid/cholesterol/gamma-HCH transport system ATP-binding protein
MLNPSSLKSREPIIRVRGLTVGFDDDTTILEKLDLDVPEGKVLGVVGASGTGKSVLLRTIIGLLPRRAGKVQVFGIDLDDPKKNIRSEVEQRWGILFQQGALFSSLTVKQNVQVPMREYFPDLSEHLLDELAYMKLALVGLSEDAGNKFPSELSGGMTKRVGIARALALDPDILFLDEPTSGLDPISAGGFDQLIKDLQQTLGLTVFMVTHDLDSLASICDVIAVIGDKHVLVHGTLKDMLAFDHPWVKAYFTGPRARGIETKVAER